MSADAPGEGGRRRALERAAVVGVLAVVGALIYALSRGVRDAGGVLTPGAPAPRVDTVTYDGEPLALEDLRGSVVVLNFWASWCVECVAEAAVLEAVWQAYRDRGVVVVGLAYTDTEPAARAFAAANGMTFPIGPDLGGRASQAFGLTGVPETAIVDRGGRLVPLGLADGRTVAKLVGPIVEGGPFPPSALRATLDRVLASPAPAGDDA